MVKINALGIALKAGAVCNEEDIFDQAACCRRFLIVGRGYRVLGIPFLLKVVGRQRNASPRHQGARCKDLNWVYWGAVHFYFGFPLL